MTVQQLWILVITLLSIVNAIHIVQPGYIPVFLPVNQFTTGQWLQIDSFAWTGSLQAMYELGSFNARISAPLGIQLIEVGPTLTKLIMYTRDYRGFMINDVTVDLNLVPNTLVTVRISIVTTNCIDLIWPTTECWSVCVTQSVCDSTNTFTHPLRTPYSPSTITHFWYSSGVPHLGHLVIQNIETG